MDDINSRLAKIEEDISEIKKSLQRNDVHISFMTRLYLILRHPLVNLIPNFGTVESDKKEVTDNYFKET
jgi:hypothetical protein